MVKETGHVYLDVEDEEELALEHFYAYTADPFVTQKERQLYRHIAWNLLSGGGKKAPSAEGLTEFFDDYAKKASKFLDIHVSYLKTVPNTQRLAIEEYQRSPRVNRILNTREKFFAWFDFEVPTDVKLTKTAFKQIIQKAGAEQVAKDVVEIAKFYIDQHKRIIRAIENAPRSRETWTLFRGLFLDTKIDYNAESKPPELTAKVGDVLEWNRITSFSLSPFVALFFQKSLENKCCIFTVECDQSVPFFAYPLNSVHPQFELILPPAKYEVVGVQKLKLSKFPNWNGIRVVRVKFLHPIQKDYSKFLGAK